MTSDVTTETGGKKLLPDVLVCSEAAIMFVDGPEAADVKVDMEAVVDGSKHGEVLDVAVACARRLEYVFTL